MTMWVLSWGRQPLQAYLLVVETQQCSCEDSSIRPNSSGGSSLDGYGGMDPGKRRWDPPSFFSVRGQAPR